MKDDARKTQLNQAKWDRRAGTFDKKSLARDFLRASQAKVISLLDVRPGIHFLDAGCGTGWAVGQVARLADGKGEFYGVDLSPKMIEKARENFTGRGEIHFLHASVESIPLDDDYFDVIICTNSFHHYPRPDRALAEFHRLLEPGGRLFVLDPTADSWLAKVADRIARLIEPEHVKTYSTKEFQQMFGDAGFRTITSKEMRAKSRRIHAGEK